MCLHSLSTSSTAEDAYKVPGVAYKDFKFSSGKTKKVPIIKV